ncbi:tetratricopeptide repeat protein [Granulicella sp. S156]|uniref:tetratricopeptide repeat protein n=1 Tax=Granulicella sp. S156 TaxID=1747224 RepID=UPI00131BE32D|nr:tetratricopeptide repeat protein [Granulicella sp. S156]
MRTTKFILAMGLMLVVVSARSQAPAEKTDAEIKAEGEQARALYEKQNFLEALPLYEDLHTRRPQNLLYQERLAMTLLAKASQQSPEDAQATRRRSRELLLQAKAAGDNSNLIQILLEKLQDADQPAKAEPVGHEWMQKGETAFSSGDLQAAVGFYKQALDANPQYYVAALFAGDAEYKLNHPAEAGKWFARAIEINPDVETAYRYWGDCLEKAGDHTQAEAKFIGGIVAEPYSRAPRLGLKQWADRNHAMVVAPPIKLPARATTGKDGHINITMSMPAAADKDNKESALALSYSMESALWQGDEFRKHFPNEKTYRHSLLEEATSVRLMLSVVREQKIPENTLSASTKLLLELDNAGMLECWILLDDPDQGIAQDYAAYRKDHRELLAKYIAQYDVHPM